jgi:hypothetical protein
MSLADLGPEKEEHYLRLAAMTENPPVDALVRLSIREEFAGNRQAALEHMDRALGIAKTYRVFLAAATQAARMGEEARLLHWARVALEYCPRDADDIFGLLAKAPRGAEVLATARAAQREDYLRFLLGKEDYLAALEFQAELPKRGRVAQLRLELAERFVVRRQWEEAARLHEAPGGGTLENARFEKRPSSLAFDWRLAQGNGVETEWFPGKLRVKLGALDKAREVMSQYVRHAGEGLPRVEARWMGDLAGVRWHSERLHEEWVRVALVAEAGGARMFELEEVALRAAK